MYVIYTHYIYMCIHVEYTYIYIYHIHIQYIYINTHHTYVYIYILVINSFFVLWWPQAPFFHVHVGKPYFHVFFVLVVATGALFLLNSPTNIEISFWRKASVHISRGLLYVIDILQRSSIICNRAPFKGAYCT